MTFLFPVLLLGLTQPADLPADVSVQAAAKTTLPSGGILARKFAFTGAEKAKIPGPSDGTEIQNPSDDRKNICLTMRSYYFERHDGLAPEFVGMTTCDLGRNFTTKRTDRPARLVPAK